MEDDCDFLFQGNLYLIHRRTIDIYSNFYQLKVRASEEKKLGRPC